MQKTLSTPRVNVHFHTWGWDYWLPAHAGFRWNPVQGAKRYNIIVMHSTALFTVINFSVESNEFVAPLRSGKIMKKNQKGWFWKVRAMDHKSDWGPWSPQYYFNVAPLSKQQGATGTPSLGKTERISDI